MRKLTVKDNDPDPNDPSSSDPSPSDPNWSDPNSSDSGSLAGQVLIAMPGMEDERFEKSLVYLCAHSSEGAMGLIINKPAPQISFSDLLVRLDIISELEQLNLPVEIQDLPVHRGGPVESSRGFVLHSADYAVEDATLHIENEICLTATVDILRSIADGKGPDHALLALGYAGWGPGQLESEIQANGWLTGTGQKDLVFDKGVEERYARALAMLGIDPAMLSGEIGHA